MRTKSTSSWLVGVNEVLFVLAVFNRHTQCVFCCQCAFCCLFSNSLALSSTPTPMLCCHFTSVCLSVCLVLSHLAARCLGVLSLTSGHYHSYERTCPVYKKQCMYCSVPVCCDVVLLPPPTAPLVVSLEGLSRSCCLSPFCLCTGVSEGGTTHIISGAAGWDLDRVGPSKWNGKGWGFDFRVLKMGWVLTYIYVYAVPCSHPIKSS
jgi:hypothetical protein